MKEDKLKRNIAGKRLVHRPNYVPSLRPKNGRRDVDSVLGRSTRNLRLIGEYMSDAAKEQIKEITEELADTILDTNVSSDVYESLFGIFEKSVKDYTYQPPPPPVVDKPPKSPTPPPPPPPKPKPIDRQYILDFRRRDFENKSKPGDVYVYKSPESFDWVIERRIADATKRSRSNKGRVSADKSPSGSRGLKYPATKRAS